MTKVVVCSRSFSKNAKLREMLQMQFSHVTFNTSNQTFQGGDLLQFIKEAEVIIIGLEKIDRAIIDQCPNLKFVCKMGTGIDKVDVEALKEKGINFFHTPGFNKRAVAELVLIHALNLVRKIPQNVDDNNLKAWKQVIGAQLSDRHIGILGFGAIGKEVAGLFHAMGCEVSAYDIDPSLFKNQDIPYVDPITLFKTCDIVSIHIPLLPGTKGFVCEKYINALKSGSILINTARGEIVDQDALKSRLKKNEIYAGLDVLLHEPNIDLDMTKLENVFVTPHIGGSTIEAVKMNASLIIDKLKRLKGGEVVF